MFGLFIRTFFNLTRQIHLIQVVSVLIPIFVEASTQWLALTLRPISTAAFTPLGMPDLFWSHVFPLPSLTMVLACWLSPLDEGAEVLCSVTEEDDVSSSLAAL